MACSTSERFISVCPYYFPCATGSYLTASTVSEMGVIRLFLHALSRAKITRLYIHASGAFDGNLAVLPLTWLSDFIKESPDNFLTLETLDVHSPRVQQAENEFYQAIKEIRRQRRDRDNLRTLLIGGVQKYL